MDVGIKLNQRPKIMKLVLVRLAKRLKCNTKSLFQNQSMSMICMYTNDKRVEVIVQISDTDKGIQLNR